MVFFENLQQDFDFVKRKLKGRDSQTLGHENKTFEGKRPRYQDAYTDETRDIVAKVYASDIQTFRYQFDNSTLPEQIQTRNHMLQQNGLM